MSCNFNMKKKLKKGPAGMIKRSSLIEKIANGIDSAGSDTEVVNNKNDKIKEEDEKDEKSQNKPQEKPKENIETPIPQETPTAPNNGNMLFTVIDFLQQNPNPQDSDMHAFAEQNGFDIHQLETIVYTLATKMVNILRGGKMNESQLDINSVDPNELEMGVQIEYEHTADPSIAKKIALDHLAEIPDYYTRLSQMEEQAKSESGAAAVPIRPGEENSKPFITQDEVNKNEQENVNEIPVGARNLTEG